MGYTHYYKTPPITPQTFLKIATDFKKMIGPLKHLGVPLAGYDGTGEPSITPEHIIFNGKSGCGHTEMQLGVAWPGKNAKGVAKNGVGTHIVTESWYAGSMVESRICDGNCSHESFNLSTNADDCKSFCKTAYKPYDLAVQVALIIANHHAKVSVSSDGDQTAWHEAAMLCQHFLEYGGDFRL